MAGLFTFHPTKRIASSDNDEFCPDLRCESLKSVWRSYQGCFSVECDDRPCEPKHTREIPPDLCNLRTITIYVQALLVRTLVALTADAALGLSIEADVV